MLDRGRNALYSLNIKTKPKIKMFTFLKKLFEQSPELRLDDARLDMEHARSMLAFCRNNPVQYSFFSGKYAQAQSRYYKALKDLDIYQTQGQA